MAIVTGTNGNDNVGNGYPWISPGVTFDPPNDPNSSPSTWLSGDDIIYGLGGDDSLAGGYGNDVMYGGDGDDRFYMYGDDSAYGEAGDDLFWVMADHPTLMDGGAGIDTIYVYGPRDISFSVVRDVERLMISQWEVRLTATQLGLFQTVMGDGRADSAALRLTKGGSATFTIDTSLEALIVHGSDENETITLTAETTQRLAYYGGSGNGTVTGALGNDRLHGGQGLDVLFGGPGDDYLAGLEGDDILEGGPGNDSINGGSGNFDTASYASAPAGVRIDLRITAPQNTLGAGIDTITGIENLIGSAFADRLIGDGGNNRIVAGAGNDVVIAGDGIDHVEGGDGNDALFGEAGNDTLLGGPGADWLDGGAGNDTLDGGPGTDTATYASAKAGVTVTLARETPQNTIGAGTDTLISIEYLIGSAFADRLTGNASANRIEGGRGDDQITGGGGADLFHFRPNHGNDLVTDFQDGLDRLRIEGFGTAYPTVASVLAAARQVGGDTLLDLGSTTIRLRNVAAAQLDASDIVLIV
jgi:Ca2+-binding RTX toxin-like protein